MNFAEIDKTIKWKWKADREKLAVNFGYDCILEHIVKTYRKLKSLKLTGIECSPDMPLTDNAILYALKKANEPTASKGGANYKGIYRGAMCQCGKHPKTRRDLCKNCYRSKYLTVGHGI